MKAEIIAVGTEILTGQITNTNAQFLSEEFAKLGIDVFFQTAVGDNEERLLSIIDLASKRSDLVVLCGGLGPTEDDLTKQTLAKYLGRNLVFDEQASKRLNEFFATRPQFTRTANNERQAQLIEGSTPLQNSTGLAVGGVIEVDGVTYVVLPGPPSELKPMVWDYLVPLLSSDHKQLYSRVLRFFGIGESQLVTVLSDLIDNQTDPTIAPYAKTGEVTLRLSTKADDIESAKEKLDQLEQKILSKKTLNSIPLENLLYGYGDDNSMARVVFDLLKKKHKTITAAESLTAGLFQSSIADFSGSSSVFNGGFVTYSIEEKSKMLQIPLEELQEHGVVSHFTAEKMAEQSRKLTDADFGIGLTGVAGPDSLEGHPAGTVFIGIATREKVHSIRVLIGGRSRSDVRHIACLYAFNLVRQALLQD
ncbi:competence-damage inducible protein [Streptococcus infantarius subsp. infantarius]|jgi:nicotinamide-nucleotide amidase|uniref:competence/damage-inducible protein A n=1 Tax=Streptococcus infantarius TaxID=102684 RepID=UPI00208F32EA|nr:competence/damage-inducible protein A [Streptococcus infantarius]MCO4479734.1 competence-damage inducible protein [Streptococcus infantarius subsp. infantarius]MCO4483289.1 competence-damage inducible protein [Streptococcus infantarius subsp. infantarius]MCO4486110.1 competence-damage inducible protein [Streptococcus infantarius subsp. infantarius]MCO4493942.1 competence-damage inducible protein [Streptococcus infantarius subsp. infantarius]MCO4495545.1 competence-damage inducible protein [